MPAPSFKFLDTDSLNWRERNYCNNLLKKTFGENGKDYGAALEGAESAADDLRALRKYPLINFVTFFTPVALKKAIGTLASKE